MSDFIREVNEDYRRDRVVNFFVKNQVLLIALALAIIAGSAAYRVYLHYHDQAAEAASVRYEAALQMAREGKSTEAQAAFDRIQAEGPGGFANLARLKAIEALAARDPAAAARGYDAMAGDDAVEPSLRDVAQIKGALIRVDSDEPAAFEKRYAPFAASGFTFHASMRELLAMAAFKRNDTEAAGRWLDQIVIDQQAPAALRSRAEAFLSLVAAGPTQSGPIAEPAKSAVPPSAVPPSAVPAPGAPVGAATSAVGPPLQIVPPTDEPAIPAPQPAIPSQSPSSPSPNPAGAPPAQ